MEMGLGMNKAIVSVVLGITLGGVAFPLPLAIYRDPTPDERKVYNQCSRQWQSWDKRPLEYWFNLLDTDRASFDVIVGDVQLRIQQLEVIDRYKFSELRVSLEEFRIFLQAIREDRNAWIGAVFRKMIQTMHILQNASRKKWDSTIKEIQKNTNGRVDYEGFGKFTNFVRDYQLIGENVLPVHFVNACRTSSPY
jgi:hypothetical protein